MVLSMILALTTAPALLGSQEAIRQSQSKTRREEHRSQRCNLIVSCVQHSTRAQELNGRSVVLKDSKLYISTHGKHEDEVESKHGRDDDAPHPFCGYFLPYPDSNYEGVVSTITDAAPILNWIYVDKDTYEVKYGIRANAQPNLTGPFDCTRQDRRMTFEGWEGFVAVEEQSGLWALYFDRDDDGLGGKTPDGTRILEVELIRREKKVPKPLVDEPQTLEQMMAQLKHKEERDKKQREEDLESAEKEAHREHGATG